MWYQPSFTNFLFCGGRDNNLFQCHVNRVCYIRLKSAGRLQKVQKYFSIICHRDNWTCWKSLMDLLQFLLDCWTCCNLSEATEPVAISSWLLNLLQSLLDYWTCCTLIHEPVAISPRLLNQLQSLMNLLQSLLDCWTCCNLSLTAEPTTIFPWLLNLLQFLLNLLQSLSCWTCCNLSSTVEPIAISPEPVAITPWLLNLLHLSLDDWTCCNYSLTAEPAAIKLSILVQWLLPKCNTDKWRFHWSNFFSGNTGQTSLLAETINQGPLCVYTCKKRSHCTLKFLLSILEFSEIWKHQNNPACTKSVNLQNVEVGHYTEDEKLNWYWLGATFVSEILDNYV